MADLEIGLREKPSDLDELMKREGYEKEREDRKATFYERTSGDIAVIYFPKLLEHEEGELPDWKGEGYENIVAELNIYYEREFEEAERIANVIARKYQGVICDPQQDEYWEPD